MAFDDDYDDTIFSEYSFFYDEVLATTSTLKVGISGAFEVRKF